MDGGVWIVGCGWWGADSGVWIVGADSGAWIVGADSGCG